MSDALCLEELRAVRSDVRAGHLETMEELRRVEDRLTARLDEGSERMGQQESRIHALEVESDTHPALSAVPSSESKLPWYVISGGTALIAFVTPQLWSAGIDFLHAINHGAHP